jgi:hypothetical protein
VRGGRASPDEGRVSVWREIWPGICVVPASERNWADRPRISFCW